MRKRIVFVISIILASQQIISARYVLVRLNNSLKSKNAIGQEMNDKHQTSYGKFSKGRDLGVKKVKGKIIVNIINPWCL